MTKNDWFAAMAALFGAACSVSGVPAVPFACARTADCVEGQACFEGTCRPVGDIPPPKLAPATVSPSQGPVGTLITLTGTSFDLRHAARLRVGQTPAVVASVSREALRAVVMPGTTTGSISFGLDAGFVTSEAVFTVTETNGPTEAAPVELRPDGGGRDLAFGFGSVAVSADGRTVLAGGINDSGSTGAAWVFVFDPILLTWSQQGPKLVGTGSIGPARQGWSVALCADGDTAAIGAYYDDIQAGAAWVFVRRNGVWLQQGPKLVGTGAESTNASQGSAVALSADGNTLLVGGPIDRGADPGSTWVFVRDGDAWGQPTEKLRPRSASLTQAYAGSSIALTCDGTTALIGGFNDARGVGAAWTFARSGSEWSETFKLVGANAQGPSQQGSAVALNGDSTLAAIGGPKDADGRGAVWLFERRDAGWTQLGEALVSPDVRGADFGARVSLDALG